MPLVSVVMPVYNGERFVAEAIESILRQTFSDFEFIIVDDGSRDETPQIIQAYAEADARIRLLQLAENRGDAFARGAGVGQAAGALITGMDGDDISLPRRLEKQVAFLQAHPEIGAVGVSHHVCDEFLKPRLRQTLPARHYAIALHSLLYTRSTLKRATVLARREYFDMRPLYDPAIEYIPDVELFLRMVWRKRVRFANLEEQLYLYRRHERAQGWLDRARHRQAIVDARRPALRQLGESGLGVEWIIKRMPPISLNWRERPRARRDITRLIQAMVAHNWVDAADEPALMAEMRHLVESTSPRRWQMFLHWYRHRIKRHIGR